MRYTMLAAVAVLAAPAPLRAGEASAYPFRTAVITYKITGSIQEGTQVLTIDDYGRRTRIDRDTTLTILGRKQRESTTEIDDGEWYYRIDRARKTGEKRRSFSKVAGEMVRSMSAEQKNAYAELGRELAKGRSASGDLKRAGKGKVMGRDCDIFEAMGTKTWLWNNLPLRKESPALGDMVQEAVAIAVDEPIPPGRFIPPKEIAITEPTAGPAGADIEPVP